MKFGHIVPQVAVDLPGGNVTLAMMANIDTTRIIGRQSAGAGVPQSLTMGNLRSMLGFHAVTGTEKTADQTWNSDTALANVTSMAVAVLASVDYLIEFILAVSAGSTPDISFDITGPAAPSSVYYAVTSGAGLFGGANAFSTRIDCSQGALVYETVFVTCFLRNNANAGTVQLRSAQRSSSATATTIHAGSFVRATVLNDI